MTVRPVRPEEHEALAALTVSAYQALLGPDLNREYVAELADVAARAAVVDILVAVDDESRLAGGIAYIPGPGPLALRGSTTPRRRGCACWQSPRPPRAGASAPG